MALLYMDSCGDHYATADLLEKWSSKGGGTVAINATNGRRSSASVRLIDGADDYVLRGVNPSGTTAIVGVAIKPSTLSGNRILGIRDVGVSRDHVTLLMNTDGSIAAYRGGTVPSVGVVTGGALLGTSAAGLMSAGVYAYVELKILIDNTVGTVTVRVNGATVLDLTGQDTANTSTVWTSFWLGNIAVSATIDFDDVYVLDGTGAAPWNDFLGDCRVDACLPTAAGATTGWTPSTGANWENVDDAAPDDDTTYNSAAAASLTDTFVMQDTPVVGATLFGVQHCLNMKKTDAGTCAITPVIRHSGIDYAGAALSPAVDYGYHLQIAATNPGTSAAWTEADFNAAEFGYARTS